MKKLLFLFLLLPTFCAKAANPSFVDLAWATNHLNASALTIGTAPDARLSANVALLNRATNLFSGHVEVGNRIFVGTNNFLSDIGTVAIKDTRPGATISQVYIEHPNNQNHIYMGYGNSILDPGESGDIACEHKMIYWAGQDEGADGLAFLWKPRVTIGTNSFYTNAMSLNNQGRLSVGYPLLTNPPTTIYANGTIEAATNLIAFQKVGIGTTNPTTFLEIVDNGSDFVGHQISLVRGANKFNLAMDGANGCYFLNNMRGGYRWINGTTDPAMIMDNTAASKVGIGVGAAVPMAQLDVAGDIRASTTIAATNTIYAMAGTTNAIVMLDTNASTTTRIYSQGGTLYSSASPASQTVSADSWSALSGSAATTGIDGTAVGNTTIFTVPAGKSFVLDRVILIPTTVTTLAVLPTVSVGKTASAYVDVIASGILTGVSAVSTSIKLTPIVGASVLAAGENLVLRVSTGATATAYTFKAIVIGVLL